MQKALKQTSMKAKRLAILKKVFTRAQAQNAKFSVRSLAQKINLSPGFVSKILNGKSELPFERIDSFCEALKVDEITRQDLLRTYQPEGLVATQAIDMKTKAPVSDSFEEYGDKSHQLLDEWHHIAVMDLLSCDQDASIENIAQSLEIEIAKAKKSLDFLKSQGFIKEDADGRLKKASGKMRLPTSISKEKVRRYHELMMKKAIQNLTQKTSQEDFEKRLISGLSIAADSSKIEEIKVRLHQFIYDLAQEFADGDPDQVYHLGVQLFPVSK